MGHRRSATIATTTSWPTPRPRPWRAASEHERAQLKALKRIDVDVLTGEDRISYDFALQDAQLAVDWQRFPGDGHARALGQGAACSSACRR